MYFFFLSRIANLVNIPMILRFLNTDKISKSFLSLSWSIELFNFTNILNILVFNGSQGIGNGKIIPAGPLREKLSESIKKCNFSIIIDEDKNNLTSIINKYIPLVKAEIKIESEYLNNFKNKDVVAFCGIGYPNKFFETLEKIGCNIKYRKVFPDHHQYKNKEIIQLLNDSIKYNSLLITTEKDHIKIPNKYKGRIFYFPIKIIFNNDKIINDKLYSLTTDK